MITFPLLPDLAGWCSKSDQYLLSVCSTSPSAEPPHFCPRLRATLTRMMRNPRPLETLFPGGQTRVYTLNKETGESRTQRFCMEPGNPHNKSAIFSYFAPMVAERYGKLFTYYVQRGK